MRSIPRIGAVAALTAAIALGASSQAFAVGADDIRFDIAGAMSPNLLDDEKFTGTSLYVSPTWYDNDNSPVVAAEGSEETRIDFDDDMKFTTKKLPKCKFDEANFGAGLATLNTRDAIDACQKAVVGSGSAKVRFAGFGGPPLNFESSEANFTVTAFNGLESIAGPPECTDTNLGGPFNCEWVGGNPTIFLHARNDASGQTSLVRGEVQKASDTLPGTGTPPIANAFGRRLAVTDGTDVAGDAGAVALFNAIVGKAYKYKEGNKTKKANYISARCDLGDDVDPIAAGIQPGFRFFAHTVYDDDASHSVNATASVDTDTVASNCGDGTPTPP